MKNLEEYTTDPIKLEFFKYQKREKDGKEALNGLMAELRINSIQNNLPRKVNKEIEIAFKDVIFYIQIGWWRSASEACELVSLNEYVTQELYDRIKTKLDSYISENYN